MLKSELKKELIKVQERSSYYRKLLIKEGIIKPWQHYEEIKKKKKSNNVS